MREVDVIVSRLSQGSRRLVRRGTSAAATRSVSPDPVDAARRRDLVLRGAIGDAETAGVTVVRTLKQRDDDRVVLLCETGHGVPAVFKYVGRQGNRGAASSHVATLEVAAASGAGIFPEVYDLGRHWSLEEWVDGVTLKRLPGTGWSDVDLLDFFERLKLFSRAAAPDSTAIGEAELQLILDRYLRRAVQFVQYHPLVKQPGVVAHLHRERRRFRPARDAFDRIASGAALPPHLVIDDLNDANVMYGSRTRRPLIIDLEDVRPGLLGFDCVWLLTTMARGACPTPQLVEAYHLVTGEAFLSGRTEVLLSRLLFHQLLTAETITLGQVTETTTTLLRVVGEDLAELGDLA